MNATSKRKQPRKTPIDPMADAFALAESLAPAGLRDWLITGHDGVEQRGNDAAAVYDTLVRRQHGGIDPQAVVNAALDRYVSDQDVRRRASDASTSLLVVALDAGYLYGLAVGLALSKGGAR